MFFFETKLRKRNRELIYKTITDPTFRKRLQATPIQALRLTSLNDKNKTEIKELLSITNKIGSQISNLADKLLCSGGPCGIGR